MGCAEQSLGILIKPNSQEYNDDPVNWREKDGSAVGAGDGLEDKSEY